ncbi:hypothetical protein [Bernardetia sp.]|uniref:hypothetical protein n=1 Tax=Bernardetia sp. TaxID=1937974 RepID=UPI0025C66325|nr:hypothetical protein [Bernardetia sp.]
MSYNLLAKTGKLRISSAKAYNNLKIIIPKGRKVVALSAKFIPIAFDDKSQLQDADRDLEIAKLVYKSDTNEVVYTESLTMIFDNDFEKKDYKPYQITPFFTRYILVSVEDTINTFTDTEQTYEIEIIVDYE